MAGIILKLQCFVFGLHLEATAKYEKFVIKDPVTRIEILAFLFIFDRIKEMNIRFLNAFWSKILFFMFL